MVSCFPVFVTPIALCVLSVRMKKHLALADFVWSDFSKERSLPVGTNLLDHLMTVVVVVQGAMYRGVWWLWVWGL